MALSGLPLSEDLKCRRDDFKFRGYMPIPMAVFTHNVAFSAAGTKLVSDFPLYLSGHQQIINNSGANSIKIEMFDGDPTGSDYNQICSITVAASSTGTLNLAGTYLCIKNGLYVKATGTSPSALVCLLLNY